jgi:hypothetical protein
MYQQLPSPDYFAPGTPRAHAMPRFSILLVLWVLIALGCGAYWLMRRGEPRLSPDAVTRASTMAPPVPIEARKHLARAVASANLAEDSVRRTEEQLRRALALADNPTEVRHLHAALAALETAHQNLLTNRDELDSVNLLMKGRDE